MKIYTKTGDKGTTSLYDGKRVPKDYIRVESYGTIDELNSQLGLAKHYVKEEAVQVLISKIQRRLFDVAGELATEDYEAFKSRVGEEDIRGLEGHINGFLEKMDKVDAFILPGSSLASSHLHVARTVCRRAERRMITLSHETEISETVLKFVNRLSDLIYAMARYLETELTYIDFSEEVSL